MSDFGKGMAMNINKLPLDEQKRFYEFVTEHPFFQMDI